MFTYTYGDIMDCKRCYEYFIKVCLVNSTSIDCKQFLVESGLPRRTKFNSLNFQIKKRFIFIFNLHTYAVQNISIVGIHILTVTIKKFKE